LSLNVCNIGLSM